MRLQLCKHLFSLLCEGKLLVIIIPAQDMLSIPLGDFHTCAHTHTYTILTLSMLHDFSLKVKVKENTLPKYQITN